MLNKHEYCFFFTLWAKIDCAYFQLSVDLQEVNFESQVIGETRRKTITLKNNGALSTEFQFLDVKGTALFLISRISEFIIW